MASQSEDVTYERNKDRAVSLEQADRDKDATARLFLKLKYLMLCHELMEQASRVKKQEIVMKIDSFRLSQATEGCGLLSNACISSATRQLAEMARQIEVLPEVLVQTAFLLYSRLFWSDSEKEPNGEISARVFNMDDEVCKYILSRMTQVDGAGDVVVRRYGELHQWMLMVTDTAIAHNARNVALGAVALVRSTANAGDRSCMYSCFRRQFSTGQEWRDTYASRDLFSYMITGCRKLIEDKLSSSNQDWRHSGAASQSQIQGNVDIEPLQIPDCGQLSEKEINSELPEIPSVYIPKPSDRGQLYVVQLAPDDNKGDVLLSAASLFDILSDLLGTWRLLRMLRVANRYSLESYGLLISILNTYRRCFASGRYGSTSVPGFKGGFLTPELLGLNRIEKVGHEFLRILRNKSVRHQLDQYRLNEGQLLQDIVSFLDPNSHSPMNVNMMPPLDKPRLETLLAFMIWTVYTHTLDLFKRITSSEHFKDEVRSLTPKVISGRGLQTEEDFRRTASSVDPYAFTLPSHDRGEMSGDWPAVSGRGRPADPRSLVARRSEAAQEMSEDDDDLGLPF